MLYSCICNIIVLCKCHKPYNDNINDLLQSNNHCCTGFTQSCRRRCAGEQAHPQKFCFGENPGKIKKSLCKTSENLCKITENLGKPPKIQAKNGTKRAFSCEIGAKITSTRFLEVIQNSIFMQCIKDDPKFFRASLGKFWQKSFAPLKMCVLLHLWHYISLCFPHSTGPALSFLHTTWPTTKRFVQPSKKC